MNIIAITNLNLFAAIKLLINPSKYIILYFRKNVPMLLIKLIERKHQVVECSIKCYPEFSENSKVEKYIFLHASDMANHESLSDFEKNIANIFGIKKSHIINSLIKRFVKLIKDDLTLMFIIQKNYKNEGTVVFWPENYEIIQQYSSINDIVVKTNQMKIFDILFACYLSIWPINIFMFIINNAFKKNNKKIIKIVFQQKYNKYFGSNSEFPAFYRYFKRRDDVAYHCLKKKDDIYHNLIAENKTVFTTQDLKLSLHEAFFMYFRLFKLILLFFKYKPPQKITFWIMLLSIFREYVTTKTVLINFSPKYIIRVRSEMYENHPITTGVCDLFRCNHLGYEHGPPVYFIANYAITDFHYLGVMGKSSMVKIYKNYRQKVKWSVMGPIASEICYDTSTRKSSERIITLIADYYILSGSVHPYENYFNEVFLPLINFIKDKNEIRLICRFKFRQNLGKGTYVRKVCRNNNIKCDIEYSSSGKEIYDFSSYTIRNSELVVVRGNSTTAWECLSLGRKLVVYQNKWGKHPLNSYIPKLAVCNENEFNETMSWLWQIPYRDYLKSVEHIVMQESKKSNGKIVQNFFENFVGIDRKNEMKNEQLIKAE